MNVKRLLLSRSGLVLALLADFLLFGGPHRPDVRVRASFQAALAAQARVTDGWIDLPGVVGTAVGTDAAGSFVVKAYLTAAGAASLPASVGGVPVVVEVTGPFTTLEAPPAPAGRASDDDVDPKRSFPRPVPIGVSTGHPDVTAGTIGARVTDGRRVFALSNNHVFAASNGGRRGDELLQPGRADGGRSPDDVIGKLHDFEPIAFCKARLCRPNRLDAALALTTTDDLRRETPDDGYGAPRARTVDASLGLAVQKYGRTTGHTHGRVTGIHATLDVGYGTGQARFEDQIVISGSGFSRPGDSGSLVVTDGVWLGDRRPVGLLFAGSSTNTVANPIGPVLDRFGVRVDGG